MELDVRQDLAKAKEQQDHEALQSAYRLITEAGIGGRSRLPPELYVHCAEAALQLGCLEISTACLKMYFEGNPPANQFLCQAYLCQGQLKSPPAFGSVEDFEEAVMCFLKAIEISKNEPRYHFMVFNASVLYFQTVRPLLQPGRCINLIPSFRQVVQSLEEVADQDHTWRAELMMHLIKCLADSGKIDDAISFAKVTEELIKSHVAHLYPRLFTLMVQHNLTEGDITEISRQSTTLSVIYKLQEFKKSEKINKDELMKEDLAKLEEIFHLLVDCVKPSTSSGIQSPIPIEPSERVAFLLELALLALQVKHQKVAAECLKELKSAREASVGQRIIMECVNCEIKLLKTEAKINVYSKAGVEARLKEIGRLDQWLQTAVREGDPQAVQAVCATQWRFCLPLLQHNLRKHIKTPLLRVAQGLEDIQSMLLDMRCQVHSELAVTEEEEGRLEASLTHLEKAMLLDKGTDQKRLSLRLMQLRGTLCQTPTRTEDKAAMLLQQVREFKPQDKTDIRPTLVSVGGLLGPDDFQMVLDGDSTSTSSLGSGPVAQLSEKAQLHSTSLQKLDGHLARQGSNTDSIARMQLWAALVKTARKHEVWDVCRAACRFCLLYDDGRWKISKADKCTCSEEESCAESLHSCNESQACVRDLLRLLAEIHFISAEVFAPYQLASIHKLRMEGVQFNSPAVPPQEIKEDPHWFIYRDWIQALSSYATSNFLRAAELGSELRESWVVVNAATYLWNYSTHLLVAGEYQRLLAPFQRVVEMLRMTEHTGNHALVVLLCDAVARGLIQPLGGADSVEEILHGNEAKNRAEKGVNKATKNHGIVLDTSTLQDVQKGLELCDYALHISNYSTPGETVPIAVKKRVVATWVQIKRLLQQQIGSKIDTKDQCENEEVSAMMRVLVGVEMLQCNMNPRHMEFSAPSLSSMVSMASECSWTDAVVEMQVWCQLASFCHNAKEHSLVLCCTSNALQLEEAATKSLKTMPFVLYGPTAVNEMLSIAASFRGLSLAHESSGDLHTFREAMKVLLSSVSSAEKAENPALCIIAARHYWNTCLPLTQIPEERQQLKDPLEKILCALIHTTKHTNVKIPILSYFKEKGVLTLTAMPCGSFKHEETLLKDWKEPHGGDEDLTLRIAIYTLLLQINIDKSDWKSALQLLDKATRDMHDSRHRLPLLKKMILVKAKLGESITMEMQKIQDEGEQCCSSMWHQVALCAGNVPQQLTAYQNSVTSLLSTENQWQRVMLMLEFGEWLYCHNFPKSHAQQQVQCAIDILLRREPEQGEGADESKKRSTSSVECESLVGVSRSFMQNVSSLREVRHLDCLVRAHTVLAVMADRTAPEHQLNLLRAYTFVLQIWQTNLTEERLKAVVLDRALPSSTKDWACYTCPDQARQIFRTDTNPECINTHSIPKQARSLFYLDLLVKELHSLSLDHLTLPIMHLAELIAHDLLDRRSLSDVYRLRIVRTCCELGLETLSPYHERLLNLCRIQEQEQMECRRLILISQERKLLRTRASSQKGEIHENIGLTTHSMDVRAQDIWLDKADVCLSMGLYQSARELLAEAQSAAKELGDHKSVARSLLSLAGLACEEQNHVAALMLLDKAQDMCGDEEFWYQLIFTKVRAVVGQRLKDSQTKAEQIIKQGCESLKLVNQVNRVPQHAFLILSLKMRGAIECIRAIIGVEAGELLSTKAVKRLKAACDTFRECAGSFTELGYKEEAAEAHAECAHSLRVLAKHAADEVEKRNLLLDGLSQMQLAVTGQEHVVLNAQSLLPPQEESDGMSLAAMRRLLRLRLTLAELSLAMLEEHCAEEKRRALSWERKTSAEIALEEFTRCTPEPNSIEQEWRSVGSTLGQVALGQLTAVSCHSSDNVETRARCLCLMGKYFRLLAVHEDPIYLCALWGKNKHEACSDPKTVSMEENSGNETVGESNREELRMTSAKSAELQQSRHKAQKLLSQASKALAEAINLCLQHNLPISILADASINMLDCHGQSEPAMAGQYLALFQSCCAAAMIAEVLDSACGDTSMSQSSALLHLHRKLLLSQEERPSSMLRRVKDSLSSLSKPFTQLAINPNHLNILTELPANLKILLLQHSEDGSTLYGAFYEAKAAENQKGKTGQATGSLTCSRVANVSVCLEALLALREQTRAFSQQARHALLKEACRHTTEGRMEAPEEYQKTAADEKLATHFCQIVQDMEDYLKPLLTQFDFSCFRLQAAAAPCLEMTKPKDKEEKGSSSEGRVRLGGYVVLLADRKLLELPLEALSVLQEEGLGSVSRDLSLQLLHRRLNREESEKVESDNKKEIKRGKGTKEKADQSHAIKVIPTSRVSPSNTFPVDARNFRCIFEGTSLSTRMKEILETHSEHFTHLWEGFVGSKQTPSLSEMQQLLSRCSGFIYLGTESFTANIPPACLTLLSLFDCRIALLFDQFQNKTSCQSVLDMHKREEQLGLQKPLETVLLLSLAGVGCVVLNQWPSSLQQKAHDMAAVLNNLLRVKLTSGQTIHALRKRNRSQMKHQNITGSCDPALLSDSYEDHVHHKTTPTPSAFNCVLYGLPNLIVM
ncbi:cilia- and flagella-associated protein 46 [Echeneis naucrates]|uniref:cilia- and flagella-associated protein 46 n=1 Tax=Echeneis naucrates TaxID=173247 RepID=UPI0011140D82|nr:cilia- and flagella-associated protein 46 [Echeneis naucrates]